jgi:myo-inositol-1-phosphate synthase
VTEPVRLAVAGVGNNISALVQGIHYYREIRQRSGPQATLPGVTNPVLEGLAVWDIDFVAAFDVDPRKVGQDISAAIFAPPNNYPHLNVRVPPYGVTVLRGLQSAEDRTEVVDALKRSRAEVLLYSLPTGLQWALNGYAQCALDALVGLVNCTPETGARNPALMDAFASAGIPLLGDDLASQFGASIIHRTLLSLLIERGMDLRSSYQLNIGGNEDFRNLRGHGETKLSSKLNALNLSEAARERVEVIPSAGYLAQLQDNKVSMMNIEGTGWGGTPVAIDLRLKVQDSSNAAGVIVDLVRLAGATVRAGSGSFAEQARKLLKSPPPGARPSRLEVLSGGRNETAAATARIVVFAYDGVDDLDLVSVFTPLAKAAERFDLAPVLVGLTSRVSGANGGIFECRTDLALIETADAVVIPGGPGVHVLHHSAGLAASLGAYVAREKPLYTICTGAFVLARLRLIDGRRVAMHAQKRNELLQLGMKEIGSGYIEDGYLHSIGGATGETYVKGLETAYRILAAFCPDAIPYVASRIESWPDTDTAPRNAIRSI